MELDDAKKLVGLLLEKSGNTQSFVSGVVMIAPIFVKSFRVDDIVNATGLRRNQVERAALNFFRYGIWTNDGGWCCEWGRMFADGCESISEQELWELQICFILDVLVGDGSVMRVGKTRKNFRYKSLKSKS